MARTGLGTEATMTGRRWTSVAIGGTLAVAVVGGGWACWMSCAHRVGRTGPSEAASSESPMRAMAEGLRQGDARALASLCERVVAQSEKNKAAVTEEEGADQVAVLEGLRAGFLKFAPVGRASAVAAATHILDRF